jgi:hypothetical protein
VRASRLGVEGKGIKDGFRPLEAVLPASTFAGIVGRVWPGGELRHGQGTDCEFDGEARGINTLKIDDYRSVN